MENKYFHFFQASRDYLCVRSDRCFLLTNLPYQIWKCLEIEDFLVMLQGEMGEVSGASEQ
jgi:hypothetical protein